MEDLKVELGRGISMIVQQDATTSEFPVVFVTNAGEVLLSLSQPEAMRAVSALIGHQPLDILGHL